MFLAHHRYGYCVFWHDVMAAIFVPQNNETAAMFVSQTSPLGVELFSYVNAFFGHSFRMVLEFLGYHGYFWGPDWAETTYRDFRYWDHFFQIFGKSVFTWLHGGHISVPKQWNGRHIGFQTNPVGAELFSFVKKVLLFPSICTDAGHATALFDGSRTCKYLIFCQGLRDNSDRVTRTSLPRRHF